MSILSRKYMNYSPISIYIVSESYAKIGMGCAYASLWVMGL